MEAEHLYQWLTDFFKTSPKISWEKNELLEAIKDRYLDLLKMNQEGKTLSFPANSEARKIIEDRLAEYPENYWRICKDTSPRLNELTFAKAVIPAHGGKGECI